MKKVILFLLMMIFVSSNLYAEELHYHKGMWCLNPDNTYAGKTSFEDSYVSIYNEEDGSSGYDDYQKGSLQTLYRQRAIEFGIPTQIPSKKIVYNSEKIDGTVIVEPISNTQIYMLISQAGGEIAILMTYYPDKHLTRRTFCYEMP